MFVGDVRASALAHSDEDTARGIYTCFEACRHAFAVVVADSHLVWRKQLFIAAKQAVPVMRATIFLSLRHTDPCPALISVNRKHFLDLMLLPCSLMDSVRSDAARTCVRAFVD